GQSNQSRHSIRRLLKMIRATELFLRLRERSGPRGIRGTGTAQGARNKGSCKEKSAIRSRPHLTLTKLLAKFAKQRPCRKLRAADADRCGTSLAVRRLFPSSSWRGKQKNRSAVT